MKQPRPSGRGDLARASRASPRPDGRGWDRNLPAIGYRPGPSTISAYDAGFHCGRAAVLAISAPR